MVNVFSFLQNFSSLVSFWFAIRCTPLLYLMHIKLGLTLLGANLEHCHASFSILMVIAWLPEEVLTSEHHKVTWGLWGSSLVDISELMLNIKSELPIKMSGKYCSRTVVILRNNHEHTRGVDRAIRAMLR